MAKVAGIIFSVHVYLDEPTSAMTNWWWGPTVSGRIMGLLEPGAEILQAQKVTRLAARSLCPQKVFHCCCWGYFILDPVYMAGLGLTRSTTENSTDNLPNSYTPKAFRLTEVAP